MSTRHKITTIQDLINVVNDDNVEVLKHDVCEWLDWMATMKHLGSLVESKPFFVWNDDGDAGIKAAHFYDRQGNKVGSVDLKAEDKKAA